MNGMVMGYRVILYFRKINLAELNRTDCFLTELRLYIQKSGEPGTVKEGSNRSRNVFTKCYTI
jgi:hypothetical protein